MQPLNANIMQIKPFSEVGIISVIISAKIAWRLDEFVLVIVRNILVCVVSDYATPLHCINENSNYLPWHRRTCDANHVIRYPGPDDRGYLDPSTRYEGYEGEQLHQRTCQKQIEEKTNFRKQTNKETMRILLVKFFSNA